MRRSPQDAAIVSSFRRTSYEVLRAREGRFRGLAAAGVDPPSSRRAGGLSPAESPEDAVSGPLGGYTVVVEDGARCAVDERLRDRLVAIGPRCRLQLLRVLDRPEAQPRTLIGALYPSAELGCCPTC